MFVIIVNLVFVGQSLSHPVFTCSSQQVSTSQCLSVLPPVRLLFKHSMPTERKMDLIAKLQEMGEEVPTAWNLQQIKARLSELKASQKEGQHALLKNQLAELNRAARKKATLVSYAQGLEVPVRANDTISVLYAKCEEKITLAVPPTSNDLVNFGKHSDKKYKEILEECPSYAEWVIATASEDPESSWRLKRLAQWLVITMEEKHIKQFQKTEKDLPPSGYHPRRSKGYPSGSSTDQSDGSFMKIPTDDSDSELSRLKAGLDQLRSENNMMALQMSRSKCRKET
eukprot:s2967_g6.t1